MQRPPWLKKMLPVSLCLVAASIPFLFVVNSICILLCGLIWLLQADFRQTGRNLRSRPILWAWIALFLLHAASYCYSDDKGQSLFDLQTKLSFLIMPVVVGAGMTLPRKTLEAVFTAFIAGLLAAMAFAFAHTWQRYLATGNTSLFFYHELVNGLDPNAVYMSWYVVLACSLLAFFPWQGLLSGRTAWLRYAALALLAVFLLFLSSRTLILLFFLLVPAVWFFRQRRFLWTHALALALLAGALLAVAVTRNPIHDRYADVLRPRTSRQVADHEFSNLTLRIFLWKNSLQMVGKHGIWAFGCGNGDFHPMFNRQLSEAGIPNIYNTAYRSHLYNVGTHSMYLHILCMLGLTGLAVFLVVMWGPLRLYAHSGIVAAPALLFQVVSLLFMLQESALQTHAGIIYFTFFSQVFLSKAYESREEQGLRTLAGNP